MKIAVHNSNNELDDFIIYLMLMQNTIPIAEELNSLSVYMTFKKMKHYKNNVFFR